MVVWNAYLKGKRQTERGAAGKPAAYVISTLQHDPLTSVKMINKLELQGIEIDRATRAFTLPNGMSYPAGTIVIPSAQPKTGLLRYLLARTFYIVNEYTMEKDGTPIRPYDRGTDTMFEFMGVRVDSVDELGEVALEKVTEPIQVAGKVTSGPAGYSMDGRLNDSFKALNLLYDKGVAVRRVDKASAGLHPGDFLVAAGSPSVLEPIAKQTGVDFRPVNAAVSAGVHDLKRQRIGMYQRYGGGNMDEGWTRFVLEEFGFPYTSVFDPEIKAGNLRNKYDVFIFPSDATATITGIAGQGGRGGRGGGRAESTPPEYRTGLGTEGMAAIRDFVQKGGTLVMFDVASNLPADTLGVGVRNVITASIPTKNFFCPGSTLWMNFDNTDPIAYGMPSKGLGVHLQNTPAFEITGANHPDYKIVPVT